MKRKELLSFIFIFSGVALSVFGMSTFEARDTESSGFAEAFIAFAVFALCFLLIAFCKAKTPVFLLCFSAAAALAVFAADSAFLFPGLITLLLFFSYSDTSAGNKAFSLTALGGNVLCLIPFVIRIADTTDTFAHIFREFREEITEEPSTFRLLLLLFIPFLVFFAINGILRSDKKKRNTGSVLLFWAASLLSAGTAAGYCALFSEEITAAFLFFAWLILLVFVRRDTNAFSTDDNNGKTA